MWARGNHFGMQFKIRDPATNLNWKTNFLKQITVKCKNVECTNTQITTVARASQGVFCDSCRKEGRRITEKLHEERRKQRRDYQRVRDMKECAWPGCHESFEARGNRRYCEFHTPPRNSKEWQQWKELRAQAEKEASA
jgi:hypothetical protein